MIYVNKDIMDGLCGLEIISNFQTTDMDDDSWQTFISLEDIQFGNTGFFVAGFIENDVKCTEAYNILKEKHKIVYQSPVRRNMNSGNMFFFAIYDSKKD